MAKNLLQNPESLSQVLNLLNANDNDTVHQGEKLLKPFLKNSGCLAALLNQIASNPITTIRLQAALLVKRRLIKLYSKLNEHDKQNIKQQLFQLFVSDAQEKTIGFALAGCVAVLAKAVFKEKKAMPELFQGLSDLSHSPSEKLRIINFSLLAQLAETVHKQLIPHLQSLLCNILILGCQDSSSEVTLEALRAATLLISHCSENEAVMELKPVLTPVLTVLSNCLHQGDEDVVLDGLDVFDQCSKMEYPLINDHIEVLIPFLINIIRSDDISYHLKQGASTTFNSLVENRPKLIGKKNLVFPCLEAFVEIIGKHRGSVAGSIFSFIESEKQIRDDDEAEEEEDEDEDIARVAQNCINVMALKLPSKYFVSPALNICSQCINSSEPHTRKAGCAVLGIIIEGCCNPIRPLLPDIVPRLAQLCIDPEVLVRECSSFAIGQLAEHTQPDILHYAPLLLPVTISGLDDPSDTVKATTCYVIEMFAENLEPAVLRPYLNTLVLKIVGLLQTTPKVSKEIIFASLAAVAVAAELDFIPYVEGVVQIISQFLFLSEEKHFEVRGRALECLGHIAVAVGEENFRRYFDVGMQSVMQGTQIDNETLKEFGYIYIANIAKCMKDSFGTYLPNLIPHLIEVLGESELVAYVNSDDDEEEKAQEHGEGEEDEDLENMELNVEEGFVNTKKAAITAMGALAKHAKEQFAPYLEASINSILSLESGTFNSLHTSIRAESVEILSYFVAAAKAATPELKDVKAEKGVIMNIQPGSPLATVVNMVMHAYIRSITVDEEKESVANALEGIVNVLDEIGQAALLVPVNIENLLSTTNSNGYVQTGKPAGLMADLIMKIIFDLLSEKLPCQQNAEDNHHHANDDEDDGDHEDHVIDSCADLITALPKYIGSAFLPFFDEFSKPLLRYAKPNRDYSDRQMVMGIYAEVILHLGADSAKYVDTALSLIQAGVTDPVEGVRRNAAYAVATIVESHYASLTQAQVIHFLTLLQPLCTRNTEIAPGGHDSNVIGADIDNALSAVARMITKVPQFVPLPSVLPVMLAALPLRVDPEEGLSVYGCILNLVTNQEPTTIANLPQIVRLLGVTIMSESKSVSDATKSLITKALREYAQPTNPLSQLVGSALHQIQEPAIIQAIQTAISSN